MRIPNNVQAVEPVWQPIFVHFANTSPALLKTPTTVKNVGSAEFTKISLSTAMYAIFAWISGFKIGTNAGLTQGMKSAAFVLRMLFRAVRSYLAPIKYTGNVQ